METLKKYYSIIFVIFFLFQSCKSVEDEYIYYTSYNYHHGLAKKYKLKLDNNNHTFVLFANGMTKDTLRGTWYKKKDTIYFSYKDVLSIKKSNIVFKKNEKRKFYKFHIILDDSINVMNDTNTRIYINDILYGQDKDIGHYAKKDKITYIRVLHSFSQEDCFSVENSRANDFFIHLHFDKLKANYPMLEATKFIKKRNKLYPVFECSTQKVYKDTYLLKKRTKKSKWKEIEYKYKDSLWHPSL